MYTLLAAFQRRIALYTWVVFFTSTELVCVWDKEQARTLDVLDVEGSEERYIVMNVKNSCSIWRCSLFAEYLRNLPNVIALVILRNK